MRRCFGALLSAIAIAGALAQDELPQPDEGEPLEIEPPMLIQSRGPDGLPEVPVPPLPVALAKLEGDLAKAKKSAASGDRLFKAGIIAKVDAENRVLKVVRLQATLATAQLEEAKSKAVEQKSPAADDLEAKLDQSELAKVEQAAQRAIKEQQRAELEAALRNLQRQQKLLALGSGRRADVSRAEKKLAELQGAGN